MYRTAGVLVVALACAAGTHAADVQQGAGSAAFTLGRVQKELQAGQSQAEVVERLGSPNILTRDAEGREAWVYDRVSSEREASTSGVRVGGLGSGGAGNFAGLLGLSLGKQSDKSRSSQRTLTVVIRFSAGGTVERFSWHDSRF
jgi:hypothetical protein